MTLGVRSGKDPMAKTDQKTTMELSRNISFDKFVLSRPNLQPTIGQRHLCRPGYLFAHDRASAHWENGFGLRSAEEGFPFSNSSRNETLTLSQQPFFQGDPGSMQAVMAPTAFIQT